MRRKKGFTLIELLVVIAIIAILAAILFPVFARAKDSSKRTKCINNLRTLSQALQMYADDNLGYMPVVVSLSADWTKQTHGLGDLYPYTRNDKVFMCDNSNKKSVMPPYELQLPPKGRYIKRVYGSYHFWSILYAVRGKTAARLDANINDPMLTLYHYGFSPKSVQQAKSLGGPLMECFLHNFDSNSKLGKGVLMLSMKGNVLYVPSDGYPWY